MNRDVVINTYGLLTVSLNENEDKKALRRYELILIYKFIDRPIVVRFSKEDAAVEVFRELMEKLIVAPEKNVTEIQWVDRFKRS